LHIFVLIFQFFNLLIIQYLKVFYRKKACFGSSAKGLPSPDRLSDRQDDQTRSSPFFFAGKAEIMV